MVTNNKCKALGISDNKPHKRFLENQWKYNEFNSFCSDSTTSM